MENEYNIVSWFVHNQGAMKDKVRPIEETKNSLLLKEDKLFHDVIKKQFNQTVKRILLVECSKALNVPADDIMVVLETLNIKDYFLFNC